MRKAWGKKIAKIIKYMQLWIGQLLNNDGHRVKQQYARKADFDRQQEAEQTAAIGTHAKPSLFTSWNILSNGQTSG